MKVLTVSDLGVATGFARVMGSIIEEFPEDWEIYSLSINYMGDPYESRSKMYPAVLGGDPYGFGRLGNLVDSIEPDVIFILQDSWIIRRYLEILEDHLDKVVLYVPIDAGPYMPEWLVNFPKVKQVCVYTEFGKRVLQEVNPEITNITVIPHGVDRKVFKPLDRLAVRAEFKSINPEHFVVLNTNRNQPRKRLDIAFKAFGIFARDKDDVKYYHHGGIKDAGIDVIKMAHRCGVTNKLIITSRDLSPQNYVTDETLNKIYNLGDIGLNTSTGEGWGLCLGEDTEILTSRGFKKIQNIVTNDEVYGRDGKLTKVTQLYSRPFTGDIREVRVSGHCESLLITEEHPVLVGDIFKKAGELTTKDMLYRPSIQGLTSFNKINLTHYAQFKHIEDRIYIVTKKKNFGSKIFKKELDPVRRLYNSYLPRTQIRRINKYVPVNNDLVTLLVSVLSERQPHSRNFKAIDGVEDALYNMFKYKNSKKETRFIVDPAIKAAIINLSRSQTLYLTMPIKELKTLLNKYLDIKGYMHPAYKRLVIGARTLWKQRVIRIILDRLGIARSEFKIRGDGTVYFSLDKKYLYNFHREGTRLQKKQNRKEDISGFDYRVIDVGTVPYAGIVYNFETENHTYTANEYVVHNCNMEHSMTGHPQIIGNHSANKELYANNRGLLVPISHYDTSTEIMTEGAVVAPEAVAQSLQYAYTHRDEMTEMGAKARKYFLQDRFDWKNVSIRFAEILQE